MSETTIAELEQRLEESDRAHLALCTEEQALSAALVAHLQKVKASAVTAAAARAAWETARRGGPLEPQAVTEELRRAGLSDPEGLFVFERAEVLAPLPYAVWVRPRTLEGHQLPWPVVRDPLLDAGYEVRKAREQRYRLTGETAAEFFPVMEVQRPVLEAHRTAAEVEGPA